MTDQVTCTSECANSSGGCAANGTPEAGVRAALAVRVNNGLQTVLDPNSTYFVTEQTSNNCNFDPLIGGCPTDNPQVSYIVLPDAP